MPGPVSAHGGVNDGPFLWDRQQEWVFEGLWVKEGEKYWEGEVRGPGGALMEKRQAHPFGSQTDGVPIPRLPLQVTSTGWLHD